MRCSSSPGVKRRSSRRSGACDRRGGGHPPGAFPKPLSLDISEFVTKGLSMYGIHGRLMYKTWMQMGGLLKSGKVNLKPILTHKFPLDDYNEAMGVMRSGNCGKVAFPMEA